MASEQEIKKVREEKCHVLESFGMLPFPESVIRDTDLQTIRDRFQAYLENQNSVSSAGRVMALRGQGSILFVVLQDGDTTFQAVVKKDILDEKKFTLFGETVDVGDFISVTGVCFITKRGEESLLVHDWTMATKSLLPLPEKWHGLQDVDERYRKRYLEIVSDASVYQRFVLRSKIVTAIRHFFDERGFLEIETPILKNKAGGAMAEPFVTHHRDLDIPMKLRISLEIEHKMLMVGGFPAVYEIGKNFRNEGSDPTHIQEFTMMEWYAAYKTLDENIAMTEALLQRIAQDIVKKEEYTVYDKQGNPIQISMKGSWPRRTFASLLEEFAHINMHTISDQELQKKAESLGISAEDIKKTGRANLLDCIYKQTARKNIVSPTFVTHYPGDLKPLAIQNSDGTAQVAQLVIAGAEITNQYAELVDPRVQRALLEAQAKTRDEGDAEAMELDEDFLTAMEYGMPPMTGFGMGIDRLVALFTEQKNLRETIFFPMMRPRD
jgi:lysyl-tRNA synthetase class 2